MLTLPALSVLYSKRNHFNRIQTYKFQIIIIKLYDVNFLLFQRSPDLLLLPRAQPKAAPWLSLTYNQESRLFCKIDFHFQIYVWKSPKSIVYNLPHARSTMIMWNSFKSHPFVKNFFSFFCNQLYARPPTDRRLTVNIIY